MNFHKAGASSSLIAYRLPTNPIFVPFLVFYSQRLRCICMLEWALLSSRRFVSICPSPSPCRSRLHNAGWAAFSSHLISHPSAVCAWATASLYARFDDSPCCCSTSSTFFVAWRGNAVFSLVLMELDNLVPCSSLCLLFASRGNAV
jgi:hypothetical protein